MPLSEEDRRKLFSAYRSLDPPAVSSSPFQRVSLGPPESIRSTASKFSSRPPWDPHTSTLDGPYHKVQIEYPLLNLLEEAEEKAVLYKPENASQRYQPLPLVLDEEVFLNAGREKGGESTFYTLYRANEEREMDEEGVYSGVLTVDVRELTKFVGVSYLMFVIFTTPRKGGLQVRVRLATVFREREGRERKEFRDYEMPLDEFLGLRNGECWWLDCLHLIAMKSDRATRHVQMKLYPSAVQGVRGALELYKSFRNSFRPCRTPDFEVYLKNLTREARKGSKIGKGSCKICEKAFTTKEHGPAVAMLCCEKPVAMTCLVGWCKEMVARSVLPPFYPTACPMCKKELFTDPRTLEHLKFGVVADSYSIDRRYSAWENFERSCADLDMQKAELEKRGRVKIDAELLADVWVRMVEFGKVPQHEELGHLKLENCPEFAIYQAEFMKCVERLDGITAQSLAHLYTFLDGRIYSEFRHRFQQAGLDRYVPPGARGSWIGKQLVQDTMFRDGFREYVGRLLNRTLRFLVLRRCEECERERQFHWHGGREYYNPRMFGGVSEARRKRGEWQRTREGRAFVRDFLEGI